MRIIRFIFSSALSVMLGVSFGQQPLKLWNGVKNIQPGTDEFEMIKSIPDLSFDGKIPLIIGFETTPTSQVRQLTEQSGIKILDYIPRNFFLATVPVGLTRNDLQNLGIKYVYALKPADKISPSLYPDQLPSWIVVDEKRIRIIVHLVPGTNWETFRNSAAKLQIEGIKPVYPLSAAEITLPSDQLNQLALLPFVQFLSPIPAPGEIENDQSRTNERSNFLNSSYTSGLHLDGTGIHVMIDDDGDIGNHIDHKNRTDQSNATVSPGFNDHGNHIAGTLGGAGNRDPRYMGMAPGVNLYIHDYTAVLSDTVGLMGFPDAYTQEGIVLTNTSQSDGCNQGYTTFSQLLDQQTFTLPSLLHVFSAGNSGTGNCGYGAGIGWGTITGGSKLAKNVLSVGNVIKNDMLSPGSSRGPATDGRIKPELVSTGVNITSTTDNPDENTYTIKSGTSHATPGVTGVLAQLYQSYKLLHNDSLPNSALIKAALLNSCDDLGNPGPDFRFGFGRVNARRSYQTIREHRYFSGTATQGSSQNFSIQVPPGTKEVRVMLYWHDPQASLLAGPDLVNDLDIEMIDPLLVNWNPWVLDPTPNATNLNAPAVRDTDHLNNIEQVTINDPTSGTYQLVVSGSIVPQGPQPFFVVYEFLSDEVHVTYPHGGEGFVPGETERIRWDSYGNNGPFTAEYSMDNGSTWNLIQNGVADTLRYYDWVVPTIAQGDVRVRISRGSVRDTSDAPFSIIPVPDSLTIDTVCTDKIVLTWKPVSNATGYEIFHLDSLYMDSIGTTSDTNYTVSGISILENQWFSVRALGPDGAKGRRCYAVEMLAGEYNCSFAGIETGTDSEIKIFPNPASDWISIVSPATGHTQLQLELMDITGKSLFSNEEPTFSKKIHNLNVGTYSNGLYLLKITVGGQSKLGRVVINR